MHLLSNRSIDSKRIGLFADEHKGIEEHFYKCLEVSLHHNLSVDSFLLSFMVFS